jgi:hypothetical protein
MKSFTMDEHEELIEIAIKYIRFQILVDGIKKKYN